MRISFEIPVGKEQQSDSQKYVEKLMNNKKMQKEFLSDKSNLDLPEVRVLKWLNYEPLLESIKNKDYISVAKLLFDQKHHLKSMSEGEETARAGVVFMVPVAVAGLFTVAAAAHTQVVALTNKYVSSSTQFFGAIKTTTIAKLRFDANQKSLFIAVSGIADAEFMIKVIEFYEVLLNEHAKKLLEKYMPDKGTLLNLS